MTGKQYILKSDGAHGSSFPFGVSIESGVGPLERGFRPK